MYARISAYLVACALVFTGLASAQERFGALTGRITDQQGAAIPGVTVVATNTQSGEVRTFVTDSNGQFSAPDLVPGRYNVRFELTGFSKVERTDVSVLLGRTFQLDAQMRVGELTETVQVTAEASPLVDQRSTLIAHNVTAEEFDRMPKGRSFQSVALSAPSVNAGEIEGGIQVNGASGAENAFTVDGIVTNSLINGQSRQNTVFEYLQEVQVKTSGISAEYGGALGGVLSAVTKSGGNTFRGEGHYYFEGSALAAGPVRRLVLSPIDRTTVSYVQDEEQPNNHNEFGGSIGGPIMRDRLFFFGSYSPRSEKRTNTYNFNDSPGEIERQIWRQQAFGKLTYSSRRLTANWSALWTPTEVEGTLAAYNGTTPNSFVGTRASLNPNIDRGWESNQVNTSGTVDVNLSNSSFLSARGGIFHDRYSDTGIPNTTSYTYGTPTLPINALLPPSLQGGTGTTNVPRAQITDFDTTKRNAFNVDYNYAFNAGGFHTLRGGYGFQRTRNDINSFYPGGYVVLNWDQSFTFNNSVPQRGVYGYYEVNDRKIANEAGNSIHSLYIQDQWTVGNRLTLNLGVRAEQEKVPTFRPEVLEYAFEFGFGDKIAPRLGAAYDIAGDGRMKVFGSWGLYYDWTKYELARGSFGAETWCQYYRTLDTLAIDTLNLGNMPGRDIWVNPGGCRDRRVPSFQGSIDPDIEPMKQSSFSAGYEHQMNRNSVVTLHYIHNELLETIEDVGYLTDTGDEGYIISNPGKRVAAVQFAYGLTPSPQPVPRPKRQYDAVELGFNRRFANNYFFSANYTISRLYGNYSGLASSDEIRTPTSGVSSATAQQQAGSISRPGGNVNRAWDIDEIMWDSHGNLDPRGRLATDRPHVVKLYGAYDFPFGTQLGAFFYGGSGTPVSTYVTSNHGAEIFVEGRGDLGRTPALTRTDLLATHELRLGGTKALRFELNVLNLFNQKTARHIFNHLNRGAGLLSLGDLIDTSQQDLSRGYDYNALIRATPNGTGSLDPRFRMEDLFEDGTRGYFTVKFLF
jgi:hypothetical protein